MKRRRKAQIFSIQDQGNVLTSQVDIKASDVKYFEQILSEPILSTENPSFENIPRLVDEQMNFVLCRVPDMEELKRVVLALTRRLLQVLMDSLLGSSKEAGKY